MFLFAAFGGATMPWAVGFVSTQTGNLRAGLVLPLISCVVMIGLLPLLADLPRWLGLYTTFGSVRPYGW
jgi:fucose permease